MRVASKSNRIVIAKNAFRKSSYLLTSFIGILASIIGLYEFYKVDTYDSFVGHVYNDYCLQENEHIGAISSGLYLPIEFPKKIPDMEFSFGEPETSIPINLIDQVKRLFSPIEPTEKTILKFIEYYEEDNNVIEGFKANHELYRLINKATHGEIVFLGITSTWSDKCENDRVKYRDYFNINFKNYDPAEFEPNETFLIAPNWDNQEKNPQYFGIETSSPIPVMIDIHGFFKVSKTCSFDALCFQSLDPVTPSPSKAEETIKNIKSKIEYYRIHL